MKKGLFAPLMKKEWKIVQHWKVFFSVSAAIILLGIILLCTIGPKLGIDFQGGYVITVTYSQNSLTSENRKEKTNEVISKLEGLKDEDDVSYGIKVSDYKYQGDTNTAEQSIRLTFKAVGDDAYMNEHMDKIEEKLQKALEPDNNPYLVKVSSGGSTSAAISKELLLSAIAAIIAASAAMLLYVIFRFELASGLVAIIALLHDVAIMFCCMIFFRIEITSTFMAAIVAILGYSINNTLVIFDRIRDNRKNSAYADKSAKWVVNRSLKETFTRTINTSITTLFAITMLAVLGVSSIRIFAIPIIVGLIAGTYSSYCIAPSVYAMWKDRKRKPKAGKNAPAKQIKKSEPVKD